MAVPAPIVRCSVGTLYSRKQQLALPAFKIDGEVAVRYEINGEMSSYVDSMKRAIVNCITYCSGRFPRESSIIIHIHSPPKMDSATPITPEDGDGVEECLKMVIPPHMKIVVETTKDHVVIGRKLGVVFEKLTAK